MRKQSPPRSSPRRPRAKAHDPPARREASSRTGGRSRSARDADALRQRLPAENHFVDGVAEHSLSRNACDRLGGRVPKPNHSLCVDEEHAVGDIAEHLGQLVRALRLPDIAERSRSRLRHGQQRAQAGRCRRARSRAGPARRPPARRRFFPRRSSAPRSASGSLHDLVENHRPRAQRRDRLPDVRGRRVG